MSKSVESLLEVEREPPQHDGQPRSGFNRYGNLMAVSKSLSIHGTLLKLVGGFMVVCSIAGGLYVGNMGYNREEFGVMVGVIGAVLGGGVYGVGTIISAMGEGLLALADIATNTAARG